MEFNTFLNKKIVVKQTSGVVKFGTLREETEDFIQLQFDDGKIHFINKSSIESLREDERK